MKTYHILIGAGISINAFEAYVQPRFEQVGIVVGSNKLQLDLGSSWPALLITISIDHPLPDFLKLVLRHAEEDIWNAKETKKFEKNSNSLRN